MTNIQLIAILRVQQAAIRYSKSRIPSGHSNNADVALELCDFMENEIEAIIEQIENN